MAEAAKLSADRGARLIDINFGCPVKKVVNGHAGSALMRDELHAARILDATVKAVDLPVTLKMRTGWTTITATRRASRKSPNPAASGWSRCMAAPVANSTPASPTALHPRGQGSRRDPGHRQWRYHQPRRGRTGLGRIRRRWLDDRARLLRPAVVHRADHRLAALAPAAARSAARRAYQILRHHYDEMLGHYGTPGIHIARKHIGWYSKGLPGSAEFRAAVNRTEMAMEVKDLMRAFYEPLLEREAA